ncbi:hypothetical protein ACTWQH_30415 [Streptomyces sp. 6N223]
MQGWPGQGPGPGPGPRPGGNDGRRVGIVAAVVAAVVALSFGLALATGTNNRDGSEAFAAPPGGGSTDLPTDLGDLEGSDLGASGGSDSGGSGGSGSTGGSGGDLGGDLGGSSTGSSGGTDSGGSSTSSGGTTGYETPTPPPDPTLEAYKAVQAGDCLRNWMTGESTWASDVPEVIGCGAEAAGVYVSQTSEFVADCAVDAGRSYLSYTSGVETVALCVTRQFAVGQCFLGMSDGSANLMSWVDCEGGNVPSPYSQKYNVTGVYSAPSNVTGDECRRSSTDTTEYWYWTIDGETTLLCAVVY